MSLRVIHRVLLFGGVFLLAVGRLALGQATRMGPASQPNGAAIKIERPPEVAIVSQQPIARLPVKRSLNFRLLTNFDCTQVGGMDTWTTDEGQSKWYVTINSKLWEFYDWADAGSAQFTLDGKNLWLLAGRKGQDGGKDAWFIVRDNQEFRSLGEGPCDSLVVSRDAQHDACVAGAAGHRQVLRDGKLVGRVYDGILSLQFSADNEHLGCVGRKGNVHTAVVDEKELGSVKADVVSNAVFRDKAFVFAAGSARDDGGVRLVADGKVEQTFDAMLSSNGSVTAIALSQDAKHIAWGESFGNAAPCTVRDDAQILILNQASGLIERVFISNDGQHTASVCHRRDGACDLFIDQQFVDMVEPSNTTLHFVEPTRFEYLLQGQVRSATFSRLWSRDLAPTIENVPIRPIYHEVTNLGGQLLQGEFISRAQLETGKGVILTSVDDRIIVGDKQLTTITRTEVKVTP